MIKDIIFDYFGTLVDYEIDSVRRQDTKAYNFLLKNGYEIDFDIYRQHMNSAYLQLLSESQAHHREFRIEDIVHRFFKIGFATEVPEALAAQMGRIHADEWNEGTRFYEGMKEFITGLSSRFRLSIISNTHCPILIDRNNKKMGIETQFAKVVTSIEHGFRKPHKSIFEFALHSLGAKPEETVFVGDTFEDDYLAARSVGIRSFWIDRKGEKRQVEDRIEHVFQLSTKALE